MEKLKPHITIIAIYFLLLVLFPLSVVVGSYWLSFMTLSVIYFTLAVSLRAIINLGQVSFAQFAIMGVGAYASALMVKGLDLPFWAAFLLSGIVTSMIAAIVGGVTLRLREAYFFLVTFATAEFILLVFGYWKDIFGGKSGISSIPTPTVIASPLGAYFLAAAIALVTITVFYRVDNSKIGIICRAIRQDHFLSKSVGINILKYQLFIFVIAGFFTGLAGSFYAHHMAFISPDGFAFSNMVALLAWVVVGGRESLVGPLAGVLVLRGIAEVFGGTAEREMIFNSILIIVMLRFFPAGLAGIPARLRSIFELTKTFGRPVASTHSK